MQHRSPADRHGLAATPVRPGSRSRTAATISATASSTGHAVLLLAVAVAERHRARGHVLVAGQQHERHLLLLRVADLLLHPVVARVDLDPDALRAQRCAATSYR